LVLASCGGGDDGESEPTTLTKLQGGLPAVVLRTDVAPKAGAFALVKVFDKNGDSYPDVFVVGSYLLASFGQAELCRYMMP
jgi:hypothetical protein